MNKLIISTGLLFLLVTTGFTQSKINPTERQKVADYLQEISVTIRAQSEYSKSEGSGVLISRKIGDENVTFVWTCGHVVDNMRKVRSVIRGGSPKKLVEFGDVQIIKELVEEGRRVGEIKMDASVVKYSDADDGEDLALLMVRAKDYAKDSANFHITKANHGIVPIGTELFHVGSLLGQRGSNSMTAGIVSQVGRILGKVEYDQTTVTAFPGSSGGGVYLQNGKYVGMIVRGAGEGFNLMVPVRRMERWATEHDILWALNPALEAPSMKEIKALPVETTGEEVKDEDEEKSFKDKQFPYMIRIIKDSKEPELKELIWTKSSDIDVDHK